MNRHGPEVVDCGYVYAPKAKPAKPPEERDLSFVQKPAAVTVAAAEVADPVPAIADATPKPAEVPTAQKPSKRKQA